MKKFIFLSIALVIVLAGCTFAKTPNSGVTELTLDEARVKALSFVNNNLMRPDTQATLKDIVDDGLTYKVTIIVSGQEYVSHISKDGKNFFAQAYNISETEQQAQTQNTETPPAATVASKQAKPKVEVFVMSHCPYGTQMEKGILPVVKTLGDKIDFELKFCDYAMHGKPELDEQLNQYCIQKEQPDKLVAYLECFLADENKSAECMNTAGVNSATIKSCVARADSEFKVTELFNDQSTWRSGRFPQFNTHKEDNAAYGITGSPGLVVNGAKIQASRDSASLLATICSGFETQPEECKATLSNSTPSPGFGYGAATGNAGSAAECGS